MAAQADKKEPNFWYCKHGYFAGECRCKNRTGDNLCPLENGGMCNEFDPDDEF